VPARLCPKLRHARFQWTVPKEPVDYSSKSAELTAPRLKDLAELDDATFRRVFAGSPIKRIGRDRFVRNVLIALGNSGDDALAATAEKLLDDPSPLVRAMAVWALSRLLPAELFAALHAWLAAGEADPQVSQERRAARPS
jgi:epoxyqueuosine reductase